MEFGTIGRLNAMPGVLPPSPPAPLQATARELERMSDQLAADFVEGERGGRADGGGSVHSGEGSGVPGGAAAAAAALKEFREDFLAQRKRFHLARAKAALLSQKGFSVYVE